MWQQIRGYIVKRDLVDELLECLNGHDFMGRWMPEASEDSEIYNKEFYWSDAYKFSKNPYCGNSEWVSLNPFRHEISFSEKILIPVRLYFSERKGDTIVKGDGDRLSWFKICFNTAKMIIVVCMIHKETLFVLIVQKYWERILAITLRKVNCADI